MNPNARTPSILVTLGRCSRLFNLYLTTAPTALDAPSTITLHTAPLVNIAVLADVSCRSMRPTGSWRAAWSS